MDSRLISQFEPSTFLFGSVKCILGNGYLRSRFLHAIQKVEELTYEVSEKNERISRGNVALEDRSDKFTDILMRYLKNGQELCIKWGQGLP